MITIANIYYLLLYSWDLFDEGKMTAVDAAPQTDLLDLLVSLLVRGVDRLLCQGLDRGYLPKNEELVGLRGKLNLSATLKGNLLSRGRTSCDFDELSTDVFHNQILKATLRRALTLDLDAGMHEKVRVAYQRLGGISDVPLSNRTFKKVHLHRNNRNYRYLIGLSRLLFDQLIPDPSGCGYQFRNFARDEVKMRRVFEKFLFNFFKHEQSDFHVSRNRIKWAAADEDLTLLPSMLTDVTLTRPDHVIIIDAKYTPQVLQKPPHGRATLRSPHLYQLFAYLENYRATVPVDGMIIYPFANDRIDARVTVRGHQIRVVTIDLTQHWREIQRTLLDLIT